MPEAIVKTPVWNTSRHWQVKGRPATEKLLQNGKWVPLPGGENPEPKGKYRLAIVWGPSFALGGVESYLVDPSLRIVFEGWATDGMAKYQGSIQFFTSSNFATKTETSYRLHVEHRQTIVQPSSPDLLEYAYFRILVERGRAWKMRYNIGIYGAVFQGHWKKVTAR